VKKFQNNPYFLICYSNTMTVVYKISITIYSMYTYILDIHTTIDGIVWSYTLSGHIHLNFFLRIILPPFIYLLHLRKTFLFKNLLHISLELARIYYSFAAHWLPPACIYCLFAAHWLWLLVCAQHAMIKCKLSGFILLLGHYAEG
jgi:hypothetical protein